MPVKAITDRIIKEAEAEADKILKEAEAKVAEIKKEAQNEVKLLEAQATKQTELQAKAEKERLISSAQMALKQELLWEKQRLLDETFQKAKERILSMQPEKYRNLIGALLIATSETGDEEVIVAEADKGKITSELLERVNRKLSSNKKRGELKLSPETRNMLGGFILRKGRKEINCSLETIFATARMELESEVAAILFSKEKEESEG